MNNPIEAHATANALAACKPGTHMAAASVDADGTARIELIELRESGWRNVTTGADTDPVAMAGQYDDFTVTRLPEAPSAMADPVVCEARLGNLIAYLSSSRVVVTDIAPLRDRIRKELGL